MYSKGANMIKSFSTFLTEYLRSNNSSLSLTDLMKIDYAIQMLLGDIIKLLIISLLFLSLGQFTLFLFSYIIIFSTRPLAGGLHCKTFWSCLIVSTLCFSSVVLFSILCPALSNLVYIVFFIISTAIIWEYAPSVNSKIQIKNKKKLKVYTLMSFIFWIILFFILQNIKLCNCILAVTFLQIVQLIIINKKGVVLNAKICKHIINHTT